MKELKHYLAAITAFTTWGFFSLVLKPIHAYPSVDILFYRVFLCSILMIGISLLFKRQQLKETVATFKNLPSGGRKKAIWLNIGGGLLLTANWFSFIYVMNHISVKATSLAYLVCPILTTVLAHFILHEKLNKQKWIAVLLSVTGCVMLSYSSLMDMVFSLIVGLSYALYLISQRENTGFDKFIVLTFQIAFSALILLPFYPFYSATLPVELHFYVFIGIIAVAFTIIPLLLNLFALKRINSSTVGMLMSINPIIAFLLAGLVFHEHMNTLQMIAYGIVFTAVLVFNLKPRSSKKEEISVSS